MQKIRQVMKAALITAMIGATSAANAGYWGADKNGFYSNGEGSEMMVDLSVYCKKFPNPKVSSIFGTPREYHAIEAKDTAELSYAIERIEWHKAVFAGSKEKKYIYDNLAKTKGYHATIKKALDLSSAQYDRLNYYKEHMASNQRRFKDSVSQRYDGKVREQQAYQVVRVEKETRKALGLDAVLLDNAITSVEMCDRYRKYGKPRSVLAWHKYASVDPGQ
ncbi:hypothetical protein [Neptuniibacter sp. QD37_11]|uniref:hypothetical protein n=1 Tax=Neptuniibacter sp. QD37_11 TaxID=3398209 RepID=UPI0039F5D6B8